MLLPDTQPALGDASAPEPQPAVAAHPAPAPAMPRHQRRTPDFADALTASAARVIPAMDEAGDDIPHQAPDIGIVLPSVGLDRSRVPVRIHDPFGSRDVAVATCDVAVRTRVPASRRGIHTSRIGDAIARCAAQVYPDLQSYALDLARRIDAAEYGGRTEVRVDGALSYLEQVTGWRAGKDKLSLEHLELHAQARLEDGVASLGGGISINHITACPCVQQTYKHALTQARGDVREALEVVGPLLTHSQRCRTRVEILNVDDAVPVRELLDALDGTVYRVQNTLPREHELLLVYRAHREPQFIEDAIRQVVQAVGGAFATRFPQATVRVESVSFESIHDYDIVAELEMPIRELRNMDPVAR